MTEVESPQPSDAELIRRAQRGDRGAFGDLYRRYLDPIYRYLRLRVEDPKDAEDLTETAFLKAYQALPRYRERGWRFSAYLYRVARNALVDHYRHLRTEQGLVQAAVDPEPEKESAERLEQSEVMADLVPAFRSLPDDYQEVIRLRILMELSTGTAAAWMRRSEGATRILLFRALRALRKKLEGSR